MAMGPVPLGDASDPVSYEHHPLANGPYKVDSYKPNEELVLVKNPAGFTVALGTYGSTPTATMIAINDDYADGRDVSWLYDVSFESLRDKGVALTTGVRGWDMALRLQYDDVPVGATEVDLRRALDTFLADHAGEPKRIFTSYTAMLALRRMLGERYDLPEMGVDRDENDGQDT